MSLRKTSIAALALAIAIAFSPLPELQAAPFASAGSQPNTDGLLQSAKAKKKGYKKRSKKKKSKKKSKKAGSKGGSCGTYKYRKGGKCVDARDKK
jgi:hypothetical protein